MVPKGSRRFLPQPTPRTQSFSFCSFNKHFLFFGLVAYSFHYEGVFRQTSSYCEPKTIFGNDVGNCGPIMLKNYNKYPEGFFKTN